MVLKSPGTIAMQGARKPSLMAALSPTCTSAKERIGGDEEYAGPVAPESGEGLLDSRLVRSMTDRRRLRLQTGRELADWLSWIRGRFGQNCFVIVHPAPAAEQRVVVATGADDPGRRLVQCYHEASAI